MYQLFRSLPRDLQWEVLSAFVGSHSVRKGELIKKIAQDPRSVMVENVPRIQRCCIDLYNRTYNAKTFVCMRDGSQLMYCEDPVYGEVGYTFRKRLVREMAWEPSCYGQQYTPLPLAAAALPPYVKNLYPQYPDTHKKKAARHNPSPPKVLLTLRLPADEGQDDEAFLYIPGGSPPPTPTYSNSP